MYTREKAFDKCSPEKMRTMMNVVHAGTASVSTSCCGYIYHWLLTSGERFWQVDNIHKGTHVFQQTVCLIIDCHYFLCTLLNILPQTCAF